MKLAGSRILITGATGGIGRELARALVAHGASVLLTGRNAAALNLIRAPLIVGGDPATVGVFAADLATTEGRAALSAFARDWQGGIDTLINNAGISEFGLLEDLAPADLACVVTTNVVAPLDLARALLPHLKSRAEAHIVNVGSVFGAIGYPGFALYSATKFALRGFSEALRRELAATSVRVHYFAPRATQTDFNDSAVTAMNEELGIAMDPPEWVAARLCELLAGDATEATLGWPEKLFVRINALLPGVVDTSLRKQLPVTHRFARAAGVPDSAPMSPYLPASSKVMP